MWREPSPVPEKEASPGFELAHNGTIFLDEISEMSPKLQARFYVIQEKEVVRIEMTKSSRWT